MSVPTVESAPRTLPRRRPREVSRAERRRRLVSALRTAAATQAVLTACGLLLVWVTHTDLSAFPGRQLLGATSLLFLGPAAAGSLIAGILAPRLRVSQFLTLGAAGALLFLLLSVLLRLPLLLQGYLAFNMVLAPAIAGAVGAWLAVSGNLRLAGSDL